MLAFCMAIMTSDRLMLSSPMEKLWDIFPAFSCEEFTSSREFFNTEAKSTRVAGFSVPVILSIGATLPCARAAAAFSCATIASILLVSIMLTANLHLFEFNSTTDDCAPQSHFPLLQRQITTRAFATRNNKRGNSHSVP